MLTTTCFKRCTTNWKLWHFSSDGLLKIKLFFIANISLKCSTKYYKTPLHYFIAVCLYGLCIRIVSLFTVFCGQALHALALHLPPLAGFISACRVFTSVCCRPMSVKPQLQNKHITDIKVKQHISLFYLHTQSNFNTTIDLFHSGHVGTPPGAGVTDW